MSAEGRVERTAAPAERRPVAPAGAQRTAAAIARAPAPARTDRLGFRATQQMIARAAAPRVGTTAPPAAQTSKARRLPISSPRDPAELEAEAVARRVIAMQAPPAPAAPPPVAPAAGAAGVAHRSHNKSPSTPPARSASPIENTGAGAPLPASVRTHMEPRFGADFGGVRVHTDGAAAQHSSALDAHAFTVGQHVYFGRDKFQPHSAGGKELIAHELTHTIQQGAAPQSHAAHRSAVTVTQQAARSVQRSWSPVREYFAGKAANIPGYTMMTVVIGYDPILGARVERTAGNILRGAIQLIPGGKFITDALNAHGVFDTVSAWAATQFETLKSIGAQLIEDIKDLISHPSLDFGGMWDRGKAMVMRVIDRIIAFAIALKDGIVKLIKDAILKPIAAFARTTNGYPLLCTILGKDPITGEQVPQDAEALLGGFLKFIGEEETWNTIQKAKAIPRTIAWFKGAVKALTGFLKEIPGLFVAAFKALTVEDIILIPKAFIKLAGVFGGFAVRFISWGANAVWTLLEIIFDVVAPGALPYIKKTGAALKSIFKNPLPFMGNLVKAAKLGFTNFGEHFLDHLKAGLIDWLTGSLPGIYIPKAFSLVEIAKFAFSVLGLTWANIREKLVKATSEPVVKAMETGFDIVVTLVRDGPAAAWDKIKEQLSNLKDMVIGGITDFVVDMVVKKAIPKLIAMFIPGAGFISAILSIYDTIMVFVNKIKQIIQVVTGFIDSIVAIAAGQIGAAAARVEGTLAGILSLAINFLAGFAGLGKVADKVMGVINKIRAPIDKALDWLVNWIVTAAKKMGKFVAQKASDVFDWWKEKLGFTNKAGESHTLQFLGTGDSAKLGIATTPMTVREYLDQHADKGTPDWNTANKVFMEESQVIFSYAKKTADEKEKRAKIKTSLAKISAAFARLGGAPPTEAEYAPKPQPTYGNPAKIEAIVGTPAAGSKTGPWPQDRKGYDAIYKANLTTTTDPWVQMHIISEKLGGSGTDFANLIPAPGSVNTGPFRSFEHSTASLATGKSASTKNRVWVEVTVTGPKHAATGIAGKAGLWLWKGKGKWMKSEVPSLTVSAGIPTPQLAGPRKLVINHTSGTEMTRDFGISSETAALVKQGRPYKSLADFGTTMTKNGAKPAQIAAIMSRGAVLDGP